MRILFVCTGNTCRSPMAEALARQMAEQSGLSLEVKSAGIVAADGHPASVHTEEILKKRGIGHQHASQPVTPQLMEWADLVLTMTQSHRDVLHAHFPNAVHKIFTLKQYAGGKSGSLDVTDPFGLPFDAYQATERELESLLERIKERILENVRQSGG